MSRKPTALPSALHVERRSHHGSAATTNWSTPDHTTPPARSRSTAGVLGAEFTGWRTLATSPGRDCLDPWSRAHLGQLADLEATWADHAAGDTLLHADIRADNILLTGHGAMVVDWSWACRGAAFTDLILFAPSVAIQGGPQPAELIASSRSGGAASPHAVTALVCALAGCLTESSLRPPPPGLPTIRAFQAAHATIARHWLTQRL